MMPAWAVKGAKVIRIRDPGNHPQFHIPVGTDWEIEATDGYSCIKLVGVTNEYMSGPWWRVENFRSATAPSQEQDVEMFRRLSDGMTILERLDRIKEMLDA